MPTVHRKPFGHAHGQTEVDLWTLDSGTGVRAEVLTYGGVLHSLTVPDTAGDPGPVVRSLPAIDDYTDKNPYFGAVVGRYANRIAHGRFTLDGTTHHIPANDRGHALHGGPDGFHTRVWEAAGDRTGSAAVLRLTLHSPHGDMGFPGALDVTATYTLDTTGTLALEYTAVTDRPTVVNLTNHAYLNLGADDILGHTLQVDADHYLPIDTGSIPEGPPAPVAAPPSTSPPRSRWGTASPGPTPNSPWPAASTTAGCCANRTPPHSAGPPASPPPATGAPWLWTTEPGLQVYTGNQLDGAFTDGTGRRHERHGSLCLETQHLPDSPNRPAHPSTVLRPGETLRSRTEWRFPHLRAEEN